MMAEEKKICPSCGSAVKPAQVHCDICGEDIAAATEIAKRPTPPEPAPMEPTSPEPASPAPGGPDGNAVLYCPSCGTQNDAAGNFCYSCGAPLPAPGAHKKTASTKKVSQAKKKSGGAQQTRKADVPHALFTTPQWITICVAAMILGGALTAVLLPAGGSPAAPGTPQQVQQQTANQPQADLARLTAMREHLDANPDDAATRLKYANDLHDSKLIDQAIVQYKIYLEKNPSNPDARVDLGICYFELQQYDAAIKEMERAVSEFPDHQLGNYNLGIVNLNAGRHEEAKAWFQKARDLDPSSAYGKNAQQILESQF